MRQKYFTKYIVNNNPLNLFSMKSDCFLKLKNANSFLPNSICGMPIHFIAFLNIINTPK